jgi:hypothetical protein
MYRNAIEKKSCYLFTLHTHEEDYNEKIHTQQTHILSLKKWI